MCEAEGKLGPSYLELEQALVRSESARREAEENREMADGCLAEVAGALVGMGMTEEEVKKVPPMFYREAALKLFASERAAREKAEREGESQRSDAVKFHGLLLAAESHAARAEAALRDLVEKAPHEAEIGDCCAWCRARAALARQEVGR